MQETRILSHTLAVKHAASKLVGTVALERPKRAQLINMVLPWCTISGFWNIWQASFSLQASCQSQCCISQSKVSFWWISSPKFPTSERRFWRLWHIRLQDRSLLHHTWFIRHWFFSMSKCSCGNFGWWWWWDNNHFFVWSRYDWVLRHFWVWSRHWNTVNHLWLLHSRRWIIFVILILIIFSFHGMMIATRILWPTSSLNMNLASEKHLASLP